jgi:hypothetical protein
MNDAESDNYKKLFAAHVSGVGLANAVTYLRSVQGLLRTAEWSSGGHERLTYRHGINAIGWVFLKRLRTKIQAANLVAPAVAKQDISQSFDELRQQSADLFKVLHLDKGPLAFFKNQSYAVPYLARLMETNYKLGQHTALPALKVATANETFPREKLFTFMSQQAPQT